MRWRAWRPMTSWIASTGSTGSACGARSSPSAATAKWRATPWPRRSPSARRGAAVRDPGRWIWRAAFRIAAGELKDQRRRQAVSVRGEDLYEIPEAALQILEGLSRLSPRQRAAMILHDHVGYSAKEAAAILGSSAATVRVHLSHGRRRLRTLLEVDDA